MSRQCPLRFQAQRSGSGLANALDGAGGQDRPAQKLLTLAAVFQVAVGSK